MLLCPIHMQLLGHIFYKEIAKPLQIPRDYKSVIHCAQVSWFLHIVEIAMAMAIVVAIP